MRNYTRNSPEAAARIVAVVLISDGHVCRSEVDALNSLQVEAELGLASGAFMQVVQTLCEDLLMGAGSSGPMFGGMDAATLASLMDDVDQPALQRKVLHLCAAVAAADRHLADAERLVMDVARAQWNLGDHESAHPTSQPLQTT
jgi:hypothetical protein